LFQPQALKKVIAAAELSEQDIVLEVGAGLGSLTRLLAGQCGRVIAVEFDNRLLPALRESVADLVNVQIVAGDIMQIPLDDLLGSRNYKVVANIPYNITSALIRKLMEAEAAPRQVVLTVQQEVAERAVALPGEMSLLALGVQMYGRPQIAGRIPAGAFYPSPRVDSAILRIDIPDKAAYSAEIIEAVFKLARAGFEQRRKQLKNSLEHGLNLEQGQVEAMLRAAGIELRRRPQRLSVTQWASLAEQYLRIVGNQAA
jgi:16S rRNA (adenine1518-N6/adenine1519-N6)-dimethyltransferase